MSALQKPILNILTGAVAGAVIAFGITAFRSPAAPVQAQGQIPTPVVSPTPFNPGPETEGNEIGEGISQEGGFFVNDLANKLNVPVDTLESDITSSLTDANNQAVSQGLIGQNSANALQTHIDNLFSSGTGFFFDIDEFPAANNLTPAQIPITGATLTPTPTETVAPEEENEEEENEEHHHEEEATRTPTPNLGGEATQTPEVSSTPESTHTPRPTHTPQPTHTPRPTRTPQPTHTPRPTRTPNAPDNPTLTPTPLPTSSLSDFDMLALLH
jgi:hypothetical protein